MKIFYDKRGTNGKYFELLDVDDFPNMKKINGIFSDTIANAENFNFNYSLENVIDGRYAFYWNGRLESFDSNLSKLENGERMFMSCINLTSFTSNLSNLTYGDSMFNNCSSLTSFSSDLSSLTYGNSMFDGCSKLTSFSSDLSSLIDGKWMFRDCPKLTSFSSKLSSLKGGYRMFDGCKIDTESLRNIANNINDLKGNGYDKNINEHWTYEVLGKIETIHTSDRGRIYIDLDSSVTQEVITECGNILNVKGWSVYFNGNEYTNVSTE